MPRVEPGRSDRRVRGQLHHLLPHPPGGVRGDLAPSFGDLGGARARSDQDPAATLAVDRLRDEFADAVQDRQPFDLDARAVRRHGRQQGFLVQVVPDQVRHGDVHRLVVDQRVARRVRQVDASCLRRVEDPRTEVGSVLRRQRADVAVDPQVQPVEHVTRRRVDHASVADVQVGPGHQAQPGPVGQPAVLEPRAGGGAVTDQRDHRVGRARHRGGVRAEGPAQPVGHAVRVAQVRRPRGVRHDVVHQLAQGDAVRDARGRADVVLEHPPAAELVAHQVEPEHRRTDRGRRQPGGVRVPALRTDEVVRVQHAVGHDPPIAVRVAQEQFDRAGPLPQATLELRPLVRADRPGHQVTAERLRTAVDHEADLVLAGPGVAGGATVDRGLGVPAVEEGSQVTERRSGSRPGADRLVAGTDAVPGERDHRVLVASGRQPRGVLHHQGDDVVDLPALGVRGALPIGGVAAGQGGVEQLRHRAPVAELLELRAQAGHELAHRDLGGQAFGVLPEADQLAAQPGAGGLPHRRTVQRFAARVPLGAGHDRLLGLAHGGAEESGDEHGVVHHRGRVADPQLERRRV